MKTAVIISGGNIEEDFALRFLQEKTYDYWIAADHGLRFLKKHNICPTHIVGDFDSLPEDAEENTQDLLAEYRNDPKVAVRTFQPEKDWTDTEIAAELALELGCTSMDILGATGTRLDHVMGNIQLLSLVMEKGAQAYLIDPHNKIYLKKKKFRLERQNQWGKYVSLFAYGGPVKGLTLKGMKYPLQDFTLGTVGTRGVSNEIAEETAEISFTEGTLLVMETKD